MTKKRKEEEEEKLRSCMKMVLDTKRKRETMVVKKVLMPLPTERGTV